MHVIIDTNIFVSGLLNKKGAPGQIINALLQGDIIAIMSDITFAELKDVLSRSRLAPYFERAQVKPAEFLESLELIIKIVSVQNSAPNTKIRDIKDQPFIDLAATPPKPDFLITGDKDFEEKRYSGVRVITASQFTTQFLSIK